MEQTAQTTSATHSPDLAEQLRRIHQPVRAGDAFVPPVRLSALGDASFLADYGLRFPYLAGAMANGIGSVEIVEAMARAGMLGFFGAAGLTPDRVEAAIERCQQLGDLPWGFNLIHSPNEPALEQTIADLYVRRRVPVVSASAYLDLTPALLSYRFHGIHETPDGRVIAPHRVIAKVSRVEVATKFWSPPPERLLARLVNSGHLSAEQARLAATLPVASDLTVEADSGGHTDNRPAIALIPTMVALRDRLQTEHGFERPLRLGAAGGIATPQSVAAAFALGASWVVGGSIHQACVESGTSEIVRGMLAEAEQADVIMAPAADMFEMGVKVQVLKRGTMFAQRATRLYELYRSYQSLDALPAKERSRLERTVFRVPLDEVWKQTCSYFSQIDPSQIEKAEHDSRHRMALVFRWYLGKSSAWARAGDADRKVDFQVWCGPSMGAFNEWTRGTFLAEPGQRRIVTVALNLLYGAAVATRMQMLRAQGVSLSAAASRISPQPTSKFQEYVQ